ncbi:MAG: hypothetical protein MJY82_01125 [Fibrobacter sp.]|nr:hypothetical protein [Fibrobacter sp.]
MKNFSKVSLNFLAAACLTFSLAACGDNDSSSFVEPEKETNTSLAESSSERSGGDPSTPSVKSSSSETSKDSSSSDSKGASSSVEKAKSSSSSAVPLRYLPLTEFRLISR